MKGLAFWGVGLGLLVACSVDRRDGHGTGGGGAAQGGTSSFGGARAGGGNGTAGAQFGGQNQHGGASDAGTAGAPDGGGTEAGGGATSNGGSPGDVAGAAPGGSSTSGGDGSGGAPRGGAGTGGSSAGGTSSGGATSAAPYPIQVVVGGTPFGSGHACALISDGRVFCWGSGQNGHLGDGGTVDSLTPKAVVGITNAIQITTGIEATCALLADHTVKCWGSNTYYQANGKGGSTMDPFLTPVAVNALTNVSEVQSAGDTTCALLTNGTVRCWGLSSTGAASGVTLQSSLSQVAHLGVNSTCAAMSDGTVQCWSASDGAPMVVSGLTQTMQLTNRCALASDASVRCWDAFGAGSMPQVVAGLDPATRVAAGNSHACAILRDKSLWCWGFQGTFDWTIDYGSAPLLISGVGPSIDVAASYAWTCVVQVDHAVLCWGANWNGELGYSPTTNEFSATPVVIMGLPKG